MSENTQYLNAQFTEPIYHLLNSELYNSDKILNHLLKNIYSFRIRGLPEIIEGKNTPEKIRNLYKVYFNILQRGLPTKALLTCEESLDAIFDKTEKRETETGNIRYYWKKGYQITKDELLEALHIIDPRYNQAKDYNWEALESTFEIKFVRDLDNILAQLLHSQRMYNSMVDKKTGVRHIDQRTDFSFEFPTRDKQKIGINIEIDGDKYHRDKAFDDTRDEDLQRNQWLIKRVNSTTAERDIKRVKNALANEFDLKPYYNNARKKLTENEWRTKLQLIFSPIAQIRIQRAFLEYLMCIDYDFNKPLQIAVIQRDITGASAAMQQMKETLEHLMDLAGIDYEKNWLKYNVFASEEFLPDEPGAKPNTECKSIDYRLVIDNAVLMRDNIDKRKRSNNYIVIRSAHYKDKNSQRIAETGENITYKPLGARKPSETFEKDEEQINHARYFLNNIFRKKDFRIGQVEILNRALQNVSVIGLLPTGGGKSLTYQLSAMLQPGVCLVVDPIKSLMQDQHSNLKKMGIDMTSYINSSLSADLKHKETRKFNEGKYLFTFISPERLLIEKFRRGMKHMNINGVYFSYGVIDEVHCVSEWGHDFRTSYLSLGENIIKHSKTSVNGNDIPLIGLTATASYDVLADVQRELSYDSKLNENAIVRHENTIRDEIQYVVEEIDVKTGKEDDNSLKNRNGDAIKKTIELDKLHGISKQQKIRALIENIGDFPKKYNNQKVESVVKFSTLNFREGNNDSNHLNKLTESILKIPYNKFQNSILIFTPHASWYLGVTDKYKNLNENQRQAGLREALIQNTELKIGSFIGSGGDNKYDSKTLELIDEESQQNQKKFINNQLDVMIATKAFGMGIDKENIRASIHLNIPSSIESFVQEGGRVARDRKLGFNILLLNRQKYVYWGKKTRKNFLIDENFNHDRIDNIEQTLTKYKDKWFEKDDFINILEDKGLNDLKDEFNKIAVNIDQDILDYFHNNSFRGKWEEKAVVNNVLYDNSISKKDIISNELSEIFDKNISLNASQNYSNSIWVNINRDGIGYYNSRYNNYRVKTGFENQSEDLEKIIKEAFKLDPNLEKNGINFHEYLNQKGHTQSIREWLDNGDEEKHIFDIYFSNKPPKDNIYKTNLTSAIKSIKDIEEETINAIISKANNFKELKYLVEFKTERRLNKEESQKLNFAFFKYRNRQDTDKAIYRLKLTGLIEDYTIDYNKRKYQVDVRKRDVREYLNYYRSYLLRYYSSKRVEKLLEELDTNKDLDIEDIIDHQVDFTYREIAQKRKRAIRDMYDAAEQYLMVEKKNKEKPDAHVTANNYLKEYIYLYFNSKYARREYEIGEEDYSLISENHTDDGREQNIKWVDKFIKATTLEEGQINNLKHLRGATMRILRSNLQNGTALMLKAYALLLLSVNNEFLLKEARESYFDGLMSFYMNDYLPANYSIPEFLREIQFFKKRLEENTTQNKLIKIIEEVEEHFSIAAHNKWLEQFKEKFLYKYQETYG